MDASTETPVAPPPVEAPEIAIARAPARTARLARVGRRAGLFARRTWALARTAARRTARRYPPPAPSAPPTQAALPGPAGRASRLRRWGVTGAFVLIVIGTAAGLVILALSQDRPSWWRSVNPRDPAVIAVAERLENAVATILTQARPPSEDGDPAKPWTVRVAAADVNAWLNARLPTWMESREDVDFQWPESLQELQIDFRDGLIHVGAKVSAAKRIEPDTRSGNYFSAAIAPQFKTDGSLWMPARWVALGRLSVPASWMLKEPDEVASAERVPDELADLPETRHVLAAFAGKVPAMGNPTIKLGDGRKVRVLGMTAADGKLAITCQTILREPSRAEAAPPAILPGVP